MTNSRVPAIRLETVLLILAIGALGYCLWAWTDAGVYQLLQGSRLERLLERLGPRGGGLTRADSASRTRQEAEHSGLVGRIEIPRLRVSAVIAEGVDAGTLQRAVGHVPGTPFPGETGNVVLAGHRDSFFRGLRNARRGDRIRVTTPDGVIDYLVQSVRVVGATRTEILSGDGLPALTLITCYPFNYLGSAPDRFVVRARPLEDARAPAVASIP